FFSNSKLKHDEFKDTVTAVTSFLTGTAICLNIEEFDDYLHLPPRGSSDEKWLFDPFLFILSGLASELNLHDRVLRLIFTWNLRPIKKHAKL
ncbi:hypothetical protein Goari_018099, partial [Gossypium aridum]|nr:hypothetical protein [Gossypium aridum]